MNNSIINESLLLEIFMNYSKTVHFGRKNNELFNNYSLFNAVCKVSDKSEMVGEIIGWFDMELPISNISEKKIFCHCLILTSYFFTIYFR